MTAPFGYADFQNAQDQMNQPGGSLPIVPVPQAGVAAAPGTPVASSPSFWDRIAGHLLPNSPLAGVLQPDQLRALRNQALLGLGTNLLRAGGPRPAGTGNVLSDIGSALGATQQGWSQMLPQAAQQAMELNNYVYLSKQRQALQQALSENPMPTGDAATPEAMRQWMGAMVPGLLASGNAGALGGLSQMMIGLQGGEPSFEVGDYQGQRVLMRVPKLGGNATPVLGADGKPVLATDPLAQERLTETAGNNLQHLYQSDKNVQHYEGQLQTIGGASVLARDALAGNAQSQFGLIDNMLRTFNPGASVRGNTIAQLREMLPLSQKAAGEWNALVEGKGTLSPQTVRDMVNALQAQQRNALTQLGTIQQRYRQQATQKRLDPTTLFPDYQPYDFGIGAGPTTANPNGPMSQRAAQALRP